MFSGAHYLLEKFRINKIKKQTNKYLSRYNQNISKIQNIDKLDTNVL